MRVFDFIARGHEWPERRERIAALALHPLAAAFELPLAFAVVVVQAVAGDVVHRIGLAHIGRSLADDDGQFHFPIAFARIFRNDDRDRSGR